MLWFAAGGWLASAPTLAALPVAAHVEGLARAIQMSVAPVFLLTGLGGLLVVLTNRLARIIDRARTLLRELRARLPGYLVPRLVREIAGDPAKRPL